MNSQTPIPLRGLDHVVIRVRDLGRMIDFYSDVLGCALDRAPGDNGLAHLRAGTAFIDLVDAAGPIGTAGGDLPQAQAPNMDHLCLFVDPWDETAIRAHLADHGVEVGDVVTRYGAQGDGPSIYIRDPEGNGIELKGPAPLQP